MLFLVGDVITNREELVENMKGESNLTESNHEMRGTLRKRSGSIRIKMRDFKNHGEMVGW